MAQAKKISELTSAGTLSGLELVVVVQDGETRQGTSEQITASVSQRFDTFQTSTSADIETLYGLTSTNAVGLAALEVRVSTVSAAVVSINAEVSLKVYRSGDFMTNARYIEFDTSASNGLTTGKLAWNSNDATLDIGLLGDSVLQVGQETLFYAKNVHTTTIPDGRLVMATGVVGNSGKIEMNLADGSGAVSPEYFLGITTQDVAAGEFGYVTHFGLIRGINATGSQYGETWTEADLLYANASIAGGLTNSPPAYPAFSTPIAIVINAVSNAGSIFVRMKSGEYLEQLHDVDVSTKVSGDIIVWNSVIGAWTNSQALVSVQADVSALTIQVNALDLSTVNSRLDSVSAVAASAAADVSALTILVNNLDVSAVNERLDTVSALTSVNAASISALGVSVSVNALAIEAVSAAVSSLDVRVSTLEAAISAIGDVSTIAALASAVTSLEGSVSALSLQVAAISALTSVNAAAIATTDNNVSALEVRVSAVSAAASANTASIASVAVDVSLLTIRVDAVSAATSVNAVAAASIAADVSTLALQVDAVSALTSVNAAAIASTNSVVSTLDTRIAAVSASVSTLQIQVNAVSALTSVNTAAISVINAQVTLTAKTFTSATFNDGYTEEVYAVSGTTPALTPNNGSIQVWTLTGNSTPTQGTWGSGQSMTLMVDDGTSATITWTSASVAWKTDGGSAPTLNTTGFTAIVLWKVSAVLYGARIGDA